MLWGATGVKAERKYVDEINPGFDSTQYLHSYVLSDREIDF